MNHEKSIARQRRRRRLRVRKRIRGTPARPRLSVFRSHRHMYVQVIDDQSGRTLIAASTMDPELRDQALRGGNKDAARIVGAAIARRALAAGINQVAFDRREYQYHGRVESLAGAAREAGLSF